jgi:hypothetical protein
MSKKDKNKNSEAEKLKIGEEVSDFKNESITSEPEAEESADDSKEESVAPAPKKMKVKKVSNGTPRFNKFKNK